MVSTSSASLPIIRCAAETARKRRNVRGEPSAQERADHGLLTRGTEEAADRRSLVHRPTHTRMARAQTVPHAWGRRAHGSHRHAGEPPQRTGAPVMVAQRPPAFRGRTSEREVLDRLLENVLRRLEPLSPDARPVVGCGGGSLSATRGRMKPPRGIIPAMPRRNKRDLDRASPPPSPLGRCCRSTSACRRRCPGKGGLSLPGFSRTR